MGGENRIMGNDLALINKIQDPLEFCRAMAPAAERICGAKTVEEGMAINLICLQEGISYMDFNRKYHLIKGKPSMKYDAMLALFKSHGGKYVILERTPERAAIRWEIDGNVQEWEYTWETAKQDRWPWKDPKTKDELKDNWSTPSDRKNMLFARLVSDSLRVLCPEVAGGIYTPEEVSDIVADSGTQGPAKSAMEVAAEAVVVESVVVKDVPVKESPPEPTPNANAATKEQVDLIASLFRDLGIPEASQQGILSKRGVGDVSLLSRDQAKEIIERLRERASSTAKN